MRNLRKERQGSLIWNVFSKLWWNSVFFCSASIPKSSDNNMTLLEWPLYPTLSPLIQVEDLVHSSTKDGHVTQAWPIKVMHLFEYGDKFKERHMTNIRSIWANTIQFHNFCWRWSSLTTIPTLIPTCIKLARDWTPFLSADFLHI